MEKEKEKVGEEGSAYPVSVGISVGDINGIGPEVVIKALRDNVYYWTAHLLSMLRPKQWRIIKKR